MSACSGLLLPGRDAEFAATPYRVCPGRPFAEASLFIIAASLLHAFEIGPPLDASGAPQKLEHKDSSPGVVS